jgi:uncharacterized protein YccT (UPF0319 family)
MMFQWLFRQTRGLPVLALTSLLVLAGCSVLSERVQTWEGPPASGNQVAVLKVPGNIEIESVNGKAQRNFLMNDIDLEYELLPGRNEIVLVHKTIWGKREVVEDGESKVHSVVTEPQRLVLDVSAGEVYSFDKPELDSRREAEKFARNPSLPVTDSSGRVVADVSPAASSRPNPAAYVAQKQSDPRTDRQAPQVSTPKSAVDALPGSGSADGARGEKLETLEAMKVMWERASAEEKREFLRWAFD